MSQSLTHLDAEGRAAMVDVGDKAVTARRAVARAVVHMLPSTVEALRSATLKKGDALAVARVAGIMAAKKTADLIPLCHPLMLTRVAIDFELEDERVVILATAQLDGKTGVEMEALTAASVAALTLYDMAKAIDRGMRFEVELVDKSGGRSGHWVREG